MNSKVSAGSSSFLAFAKSTAVFFVGSSMSKVISLLLIPLYTNTLPSADYGYYDLSITCATLLTSFLYCDIWSSVMRMMRDDLEGEAPWKVVASGWVIFSLSSCLYIVIALCAAHFVYIPSLLYVIIYGVTTNIQSMFSCIARGKGNNVDFAASGILCTLVNVALNLILILACKFGYESLYISYAVGFIAQCVFLYFRMEMWNHLTKPDAKQIRELFLYSAPLGINSVAYWLLTSLSRVVVAAVLSLSASGVFAIGSKFGSTIALATSCFTLAWQDIAFTRELRHPSFYSSAVTQYSGFLMSSTSLLLPIISLLFPFFVGGGYENAYVTVPSFLWVAIASAISTFIGNIFYVIKDTKTIGISMVASCFVNVILVYPLTVVFDCTGANLSVLLSFAINIAIRMRILRKKIELNIKWRDWIIPFSLLIGCSIAYFIGGAAINLCALIVAVLGFLLIYREKLRFLIKAFVSRFGGIDHHGV